MPRQLKVTTGQHSRRGRKTINQDFHGIYMPRGHQLNAKGIAVAIADGISSSGVSQIASEAAVKGFLEDYFCTSDAWSVKKSGQCVLAATNAWLFSQTRQSQYRYDRDKGYVCTFSALILKGATAHIFHVGDARVYRVQHADMEQLTRDHRVWVSREQTYLGRALGVSPQLEIDYHTIEIDPGDTFVLATDGTYEYVPAAFICHTIREHGSDLDMAAERITAEAYARGSTDNLTVQIVRVDQVPSPDPASTYHRLRELSPAPLLEPRTLFDGFRILRELHASSRSHVYLAKDLETGESVAIKTPSVDLRGDSDYLERFIMEDWIARRINSPHVLRPWPLTRNRNYLYTVTEFVEGQTLNQWIIDNPEPDVETVRRIIEQVAKGLRAFHRMEMVHGDLRPANIMIDANGTARIIDFGSTRVAGVTEGKRTTESSLGTAQYSAPEQLLGEASTSRSDLFALGVIAYQMLSGRLPYGTAVAKCRTRAAQHRLRYHPLTSGHRSIPSWVDGAIRKAVHPNPYKRHEALSEFVYDLRHPNKALSADTRPPLMERNPVAFWQGISVVLVLVILALLADF